MKKHTIALIAIIIFIFLPSCAEQNAPSAIDIVKSLTDAEFFLPAGKIYSTAATEGEDEYISDPLISTLFGGASIPVITTDWIDCAMFLPLSDHPCEFAVIRCASSDAAKDTASLLSLRLLSIKKTKGGKESNELLDTSRVIVYKNYACLIISSDSAAAEKLIKTMIP